MTQRIVTLTLSILMIAGLGCAQTKELPAGGSAVPFAGADRFNSEAVARNEMPVRDPVAEALARDRHKDIGAPLQRTGTTVPPDFSNDPRWWLSRWNSATERVLHEAAVGLIYHVPPEEWTADTLRCYTFAIPVAGPDSAEPALIEQASITTERTVSAVRDLGKEPMRLLVSNASGEELIVETPGMDASGSIAWYPTSLYKTPPPDMPIRKGAHTGLDAAWLEKNQTRKKTGWELEDHAWRLINGGGKQQSTAAEGRYLCAGDSIRAFLMSTAQILGEPPTDLVDAPRRATLTLTNLIPAPEESAPILVQFDGVQAYRVRVTLPNGIAYDSVLCFKILGEKFQSSWYSYVEFMHGVGRPVTWTTLGAYDLAPCP